MRKPRSGTRIVIEVSATQARVLGELAAKTRLTLDEYVGFLVDGRVVDELRGVTGPVPQTGRSTPTAPAAPAAMAHLPNPPPDAPVERSDTNSTGYVGVSVNGRKFRAKVGGSDLGVQFEDAASAAYARYWFKQGLDRAEKIDRLRLGRGFVTPDMLGLDADQVPPEIHTLIANRTQTLPPAPDPAAAKHPAMPVVGDEVVIVDGRRGTVINLAPSPDGELIIVGLRNADGSKGDLMSFELADIAEATSWR